MRPNQHRCEARPSVHSLANPPMPLHPAIMVRLHQPAKSATLKNLRVPWKKFSVQMIFL
jgi:hypothetical protein